MKVAVFGAGYAGLTVARRLEESAPEGADLVVVDESGEHLVRHELHRVVRRPGFADELVIPLSDVLERATVRRQRVDEVDIEAGQATLENGETIAYDLGAVCLGARTNFYGLHGVREHAQRLEGLEDARGIRETFLSVLDSGGRVVIGGAGLTGVQLAGELAELADEEGAKDDVGIVLLEQLDDVAPGFPRGFRTAVREELDLRNIDVHTDAEVSEATAEVVRANGRAFEYDQFVWAGGIRGPTPLGGDRPIVRGTMQATDRTFILGDAATVIDRDGEVIPASAQAAVQEGRTAAKNIARLAEHALEGEGAFEPRLESIEFSPRGWIVSVGDGAVAQLGPAVLRGSPALALKASAGVGYLSSVGAIREAVEIAVEEFGGGSG